MPDTTSQSLSEAAREVAKWLNEEPNRPVDRQALALLVAHVQREMDAKAEPVARVQATAPERIYLCVSNDEADANEPFHDQGPRHYGDGVTWSTDEPVSVTVPYVRADLAHPPAAQDREPMTDEQAKDVLWHEHLRWMEAAGMDTEGMVRGEWLNHWLCYVRSVERFHNIIKEPQR